MVILYPEFQQGSGSLPQAILREKWWLSTWLGENSIAVDFCKPVKSHKFWMLVTKFIRMTGGGVPTCLSPNCLTRDIAPLPPRTHHHTTTITLPQWDISSIFANSPREEASSVLVVFIHRLRDALKKNYRIIWEFFPNGGPLIPKNIVYFAF